MTYLTNATDTEFNAMLQDRRHNMHRIPDPVLMWAGEEEAGAPQQWKEIADAALYSSEGAAGGYDDPEQDGTGFVRVVIFMLAVYAVASTIFIAAKL